MPTTAAEFLRSLTDAQRERALHAFDDPRRRQWTYLPGTRPGVPLHELGVRARKLAHRLLSSALDRHAFAQAVTIMALEEVLDLDEGGRRFRHSGDYFVALFGTPDSPAWSWRFEGHHLSVTATLVEGRVEVAPLFLGARPASVLYGGAAAVVRPLPLEEELARALLGELTAAQRAVAIVDGTAPPDILTGTDAAVERSLEPVGVRGADLGVGARDLLGRLAAVYADRVAPEARPAFDVRELAFAWAGPARRGLGHYYRIQGGDLLVEYDNTQNNATHAHSVLRRPGADFGSGLLAAHLADEL
ncbi:DUF3500 domain-containing protein [Thermoactinospora rubra]|uniref:DUF3500 domain-containing protein n=1 Tax=Thermoactinospora rubra TaxID=1088767 RepID=UPI001180CFC7|nr:DUF3500 domain-containing protein [Thermoactinospora rubra]